jgi:hypothetical protein
MTFDADTLKALAVMAAIYFGARWLVNDSKEARNDDAQT